MRIGLALALYLALAGCRGSPDTSDREPRLTGTEATDESDEADEIEKADVSDLSGQLKGGETYQQYDARRDSYAGSRGVYWGDGCTVDCGGHDAGYRWAEEQGITDPDQCGGKSWSFEEGCRAYAEGRGGGDAETESDGEDSED